MRATLATLSLLVPLLLAAPHASATAHEYELWFDCPEAEPTDAIPDPAGPAVENALAPARAAAKPVEEAARPCPLRIRSEDHYLGSPAVAVNPLNPNQIAIAALGGIPLGTPTPATRGGSEPHVLLTSEDGGLTFTLTPIPAPAQGLLAESVALVTDEGGNLTLAALYSREGATGPTTVAAWKLGPFPGTAGIGAKPLLLEAWAPAADLGNLHLHHEPVNDTTVLLWQEHGVAPDARAAVGPGTWVRAAWTPNDPTAAWEVLPHEKIIGPCSDLANPVSHAGRVYVACAAGTGYLRNETATDWDPVDPGDIVLHGFDPGARNLTFLSATPFGGVPHLAVSDQGRVAVIAVTVLDPARVQVLFTTGRNGANWTGGRDIGQLLHMPVEAPVRDARILAFSFKNASDTFHLLYEERPLVAEGSNDPLAPRTNKTLAAVTLQGLFLHRGNLTVDAPATRLARDASPAALAGPLPEDARDSLVAVGTRELAAYGDAGTLVFGELLETPRQKQIPDKVAPSSITTGVTNKPPRPFTLQFLVTASALATLVVVAALVRPHLGGPK